MEYPSTTLNQLVQNNKNQKKLRNNPYIAVLHLKATVRPSIRSKIKQSHCKIKTVPTTGLSGILCKNDVDRIC